MQDRVYIPHIQIREQGALIYGIPDPPHEHRRNTGFAGKAAYGGQMSAGARKRLGKCLDVLLQISPTRTVTNPHTQKPNTFRLTFLTLTLSSRNLIPHREAYEKGLALFLLKMRRSWSEQYIWKAELQARGQIHYHIVANQFIVWTDVKNYWNALQRKAGWLDAYREEKGHWQPNSTDIHAVQKVNDIGAYLGKYLSKEPGAAIDGKVWGASSGLLAAKRFSCELSTTTERRAEAMVASGKAKRVDLEQCVVLKMPKPEFLLDATDQYEYQQWRSTV